MKPSQKYVFPVTSYLLPNMSESDVGVMMESQRL